MNRPLRTTLFFGLISGLATLPAIGVAAGILGWPVALKCLLWADLALYAMLLARWGNRRFVPVAFPLLLLLGAALWPKTHAGFYLLALGVFSWIRSGICFSGSPMRLLTAEMVTMVGGAALVAAWSPVSAPSWALCVWLFFIVQSLYFLMVPVPDHGPAAKAATNGFEKLAGEIDRILDGGC